MGRKQVSKTYGLNFVVENMDKTLRDVEKVNQSLNDVGKSTQNIPKETKKSMSEAQDMMDEFKNSVYSSLSDIERKIDEGFDTTKINESLKEVTDKVDVLSKSLEALHADTGLEGLSTEFKALTESINAAVSSLNIISAFKTANIDLGNIEEVTKQLIAVKNNAVNTTDVFKSTMISISKTLSSKKIDMKDFMSGNSNIDWLEVLGADGLEKFLNQLDLATKYIKNNAEDAARIINAGFNTGNISIGSNTVNALKKDVRNNLDVMYENVQREADKGEPIGYKFKISLSDDDGKDLSQSGLVKSLINRVNQIANSVNDGVNAKGTHIEIPITLPEADALIGNVNKLVSDINNLPIDAIKLPVELEGLGNAEEAKAFAGLLGSQLSNIEVLNGNFDVSTLAKEETLNKIFNLLNGKFGNFTPTPLQQNVEPETPDNTQQELASTKEIRAFLNMLSSPKYIDRSLIIGPKGQSQLSKYNNAQTEKMLKDEGMYDDAIQAINKLLSSISFAEDMSDAEKKTLVENELKKSSLYKDVTSVEINGNRKNIASHSPMMADADKWQEYLNNALTKSKTGEEFRVFLKEMKDNIISSRESNRKNLEANFVTVVSDKNENGYRILGKDPAVRANTDGSNSREMDFYSGSVTSIRDYYVKAEAQARIISETAKTEAYALEPVINNLEEQQSLMEQIVHLENNEPDNTEKINNLKEELRLLTAVVENKEEFNKTEKQYTDLVAKANKGEALTPNEILLLTELPDRLDKMFKNISIDEIDSYISENMKTVNGRSAIENKKDLLRARQRNILDIRQQDINNLILPGSGQLKRLRNQADGLLQKQEGFAIDAAAKSYNELYERGVSKPIKNKDEYVEAMKELSDARDNIAIVSELIDGSKGNFDDFGNMVVAEKNLFLAISKKIATDEGRMKLFRVLNPEIALEAEQEYYSSEKNYGRKTKHSLLGDDRDLQEKYYKVLEDYYTAYDAEYDKRRLAYEQEFKMPYSGQDFKFSMSDWANSLNEDRKNEITAILKEVAVEFKGNMPMNEIEQFIRNLEKDLVQNRKDTFLNDSILKDTAHNITKLVGEDLSDKEISSLAKAVTGNKKKNNKDSSILSKLTDEQLASLKEMSSTYLDCLDYSDKLSNSEKEITAELEKQNAARKDAESRIINIAKRDEELSHEQLKKRIESNTNWLRNKEKQAQGKDSNGNYYFSDPDEQEEYNAYKRRLADDRQSYATLRGIKIEVDAEGNLKESKKSQYGSFEQQKADIKNLIELRDQLVAEIAFENQLTQEEIEQLRNADFIRLNRNKEAVRTYGRKGDGTVADTLTLASTRKLSTVNDPRFQALSDAQNELLEISKRDRKAFNVLVDSIYYDKDNENYSNKLEKIIKESGINPDAKLMSNIESLIGMDKNIANLKRENNRYVDLIETPGLQNDLESWFYDSFISVLHKITGVSSDIIDTIDPIEIYKSFFTAKNGGKSTYDIKDFYGNVVSSFDWNEVAAKLIGTDFKGNKYYNNFEEPKSLQEIVSLLTQELKLTEQEQNQLLAKDANSLIEMFEKGSILKLDKYDNGQLKKNEGREINFANVKDQLKKKNEFLDPETFRTLEDYMLIVSGTEKLDEYRPQIDALKNQLNDIDKRIKVISKKKNMTEEDLTTLAQLEKERKNVKQQRRSLLEKGSSILKGNYKEIDQRELDAKALITKLETEYGKEFIDQILSNVSLRNVKDQTGKVVAKSSLYSRRTGETLVPDEEVIKQTATAYMKQRNLSDEQVKALVLQIETEKKILSLENEITRDKKLRSELIDVSTDEEEVTALQDKITQKEASLKEQVELDNQLQRLLADSLKETTNLSGEDLDQEVIRLKQGLVDSSITVARVLNQGVSEIAESFADASAIFREVNDSPIDHESNLIADEARLLGKTFYEWASERTNYEDPTKYAFENAKSFSEQRIQARMKNAKSKDHREFLVFDDIAKAFGVDSGAAKRNVFEFEDTYSNEAERIAERNNDLAKLIIETEKAQQEAIDKLNESAITNLSKYFPGLKNGTKLSYSEGNNLLKILDVLKNREKDILTITGEELDTIIAETESLSEIKDIGSGKSLNKEDLRLLSSILPKLNAISSENLSDEKFSNMTYADVLNAINMSEEELLTYIQNRSLVFGDVTSKGLSDSIRDIEEYLDPRKKAKRLESEKKNSVNKPTEMIAKLYSEEVLENMETPDEIAASFNDVMYEELFSLVLKRRNTVSDMQRKSNGKKGINSLSTDMISFLSSPDSILFDFKENGKITKKDLEKYNPATAEEIFATTKGSTKSKTVSLKQYDNYKEFLGQNNEIIALAKEIAQSKNTTVEAVLSEIQPILSRYVKSIEVQRKKEDLAVLKKYVGTNGNDVAKIFSKVDNIIKNKPQKEASEIEGYSNFYDKIFERFLSEKSLNIGEGNVDSSISKDTTSQRIDKLIAIAFQKGQGSSLGYIFNEKESMIDSILKNEDTTTLKKEIERLQGEYDLNQTMGLDSRALKNKIDNLEDILNFVETSNNLLKEDTSTKAGYITKTRGEKNLRNKYFNADGSTPYGMYTDESGNRGYEIEFEIKEKEKLLSTEKDRVPILKDIIKLEEEQLSLYKTTNSVDQANLKVSLAKHEHLLAVENGVLPDELEYRVKNLEAAQKERREMDGILGALKEENAIAEKSEMQPSERNKKSTSYVRPNIARTDIRTLSQEQLDEQKRTSQEMQSSIDSDIEKLKTRSAYVDAYLSKFNAEQEETSALRYALNDDDASAEMAQAWKFAAMNEAQAKNAFNIKNLNDEKNKLEEDLKEQSEIYNSIDSLTISEKEKEERKLQIQSNIEKIQKEIEQKQNSLNELYDKAINELGLFIKESGYVQEKISFEEFASDIEGNLTNSYAQSAYYGETPSTEPQSDIGRIISLLQDILVVLNGGTVNVPSTNANKNVKENNTSSSPIVNTTKDVGELEKALKDAEDELESFKSNDIASEEDEKRIKELVRQIANLKNNIQEAKKVVKAPTPEPPKNKDVKELFNEKNIELDENGLIKSTEFNKLDAFMRSLSNTFGTITKFDNVAKVLGLSEGNIKILEESYSRINKANEMLEKINEGWETESEPVKKEQTAPPAWQEGTISSEPINMEKKLPYTMEETKHNLDLETASVEELKNRYNELNEIKNKLSYLRTSPDATAEEIALLMSAENSMTEISQRITVVERENKLQEEIAENKRKAAESAKEVTEQEKKALELQKEINNEAKSQTDKNGVSSSTASLEQIESELDAVNEKAQKTQDALNSIEQKAGTMRVVHWVQDEGVNPVLNNPDGISTEKYGMIQSFCDELGDAEASSKAILEYWDRLHTHEFGNKGIVIDIPEELIKLYNNPAKIPDFIPQEYIKGVIDANEGIVVLNRNEQNLISTQEKLNDVQSQQQNELTKSVIEQQKAAQKVKEISLETWLSANGVSNKRYDRTNKVGKLGKNLSFLTGITDANGALYNMVGKEGISDDTLKAEMKKAITMMKKDGGYANLGFAEGLTDATATDEATEEFCNKIINDVRKYLGIHSPSTLFRMLGYYCDAGFVEGIQDGEKEVHDAILGIFKAAKISQAEFNKILGGSDYKALANDDVIKHAIDNIVANGELNKAPISRNELIANQTDAYNFAANGKIFTASRNKKGAFADSVEFSDVENEIANLSDGAINSLKEELAASGKGANVLASLLNEVLRESKNPKVVDNAKKIGVSLGYYIHDGLLMNAKSVLEIGKNDNTISTKEAIAIREGIYKNTAKFAGETGITPGEDFSSILPRKSDRAIKSMFDNIQRKNAADKLRALNPSDFGSNANIIAEAQADLKTIFEAKSMKDVDDLEEKLDNVFTTLKNISQLKFTGNLASTVTELLVIGDNNGIDYNATLKAISNEKYKLENDQKKTRSRLSADEYQKRLLNIANAESSVDFNIGQIIQGSGLSLSLDEVKAGIKNSENNNDLKKEGIRLIREMADAERDLANAQNNTEASALATERINSLNTEYNTLLATVSLYEKLGTYSVGQFNSDVQNESDKAEYKSAMYASKAVTTSNSIKNADTANYYKKLANDAKEYFDLVKKGDSRSEQENKRFNALKNAYEELNGQVGKYNVELNAEERSILAVTNAQQKFVDAMSGGAYIKKADSDITKYIEKLEKMKDQAKYPDHLRQKFADLIKVLESNRNVLDFTDFEGEGNLEKAFLIIDDSKKKMDELLEESARYTPATGFKKISADISDKLAKNTAMSKEMRHEYEALRDRAEAFANSTDATKQDLARIKDEFFDLNNELAKSGKLGKSFVDKLKDQVITRSIGYISRYLSLQDFIRYGRNIVSTITELDTSLIDLKKTFKGTDEQLNQFYYDANDTAKNMGVTTNAIIEQAAAWSRLGYSTAEAATQMAEISSMFSSISPGMDTQTAQEGLVSIMKAWNIDTDNVVSEISDKINILGKVMPNLAVM